METAIAVIGALGIGGIVGRYFESLWGKNRETELRMQNLNENKYRSILILMRCILEPENADQFTFDNPKIQKQKTPKLVKEYALRNLKEMYYNCTLYASDEVVMEFKNFLSHPSEDKFFRTSAAMRKDLWKTKTKLDMKSLSLK